MGFLPVAAVALGAIGTAVSAAGAVESGQAQSKAAAYQAQVAQNNATIANQNAEAATQAGQAKATTESLKGRATEGAAIAAEAASGIDPNSGSAADVNVTNREINKLDTLTTINNAALQAYGYRSQATGFTSQAGLDTATSQQATTAGDIGAIGSLASGASSLGSKWVQFQQSGATGSAPDQTT